MLKRFATLCAMLALCLSASAASKPDYITRNADGSIRTRGVYAVDEAGRVQKFTVYDGAGALLYTEIPYYDPTGRIIRCDTFDASNKLKSVGVMFDTFVTILGPDGKIIRIQDGLKHD